MFKKTTGVTLALLVTSLWAVEARAVATSGATRASATSALFTVNSTSWADIHYTVNSGGQLNVRMTQTGSQNQYTVTGLANGDVVNYSFTYWDTSCSCGTDIATARYTHSSTGGSSDAGTPDAGSDAGTSTDAGTGSGDGGTPPVIDGGTGGSTGSTNVVPLFNSTTTLEPALVETSSTAITTHVGERVRDRHARESQFQAYEHFLENYFVNRTFYIDIVDQVAKGGSQVIVNLHTVYPMDGPNCRAFFRGVNTVAEYWANGTYTKLDDYTYTCTFNYNAKESRAIQIGDRMEMEVGVFLHQPVDGRFNYYSGVWLYIVGSGGIVPFQAQGSLLDSYPMPQAGWSGGLTTQNYPYSNEPSQHFMQMALNLAPVSTQTWVEGRRLQHTNFDDGSHTEPGNPVFTEQANKLGPNYVARSCIVCHQNNGRALPPTTTNTTLDNIVVKVGRVNGTTVTADPNLGAKIQPRRTSGTPEADVRISNWVTTSGTFADGTAYSLRQPVYSFLNVVPSNYSARISPQLVGIGLLEAVPESAIAALADPTDANKDGISGNMRNVTDPETGQLRMGRFGWKAGNARVRHQVADAFNGDMGVTTSVFKTLDCGSAETGCSGSSTELSDSDLDKLTRYISLLGVPARRSLDDATALKGETLFSSAGCAKCHTATLTTSAYHPYAELRNQTIHPYTDLLLHDMGTGLADTLPEGNAAGAEWRTAPLWGIGLTAGVSGGEAYLHDGRARSLSEAILWHGGEGTAAKTAFVNMSATDRAALLAFLQSL